MIAMFHTGGQNHILLFKQWCLCILVHILVSYLRQLHHYFTIGGTRALRSSSYLGDYTMFRAIGRNYVLLQIMYIPALYVIHSLASNNTFLDPLLCYSSVSALIPRIPSRWPKLYFTTNYVERTGLLKRRCMAYDQKQTRFPLVCALWVWHDDTFTLMWIYVYGITTTLFSPLTVSCKTALDSDKWGFFFSYEAVFR